MAVIPILVIGLALVSGCDSNGTNGSASENETGSAAESVAETTGEVGAETDAAAEVPSLPVEETPAVTPAPPEASFARAGPPERVADGPAAALSPEKRDGLYSEPPPMTIDPERYYYATLKTEQGDIRIQLFADRAPVTVNNFVFLANEGFYNDTIFHRVIDGFMAQAGDPTGTGGGGPGYTFEDEIHPGMLFDQAGLLAMANRGPDTNGSQFFLTFGPTEWLDFRHTIFGRVIEGEDVMARISLRDPADGPDAPADLLYTVLIEEQTESVLPTPTPMPPTPTPTPTPTPFAPTGLDLDARPLAELSPAERVNYFNQPPEIILAPGEQYTATLVTSRGELTIELYADTHPKAVNNFIVLARLGFYDDTPIALVRPDDSIIFGVPDNNPLNDAGYKFPAEMGIGEDPDFGSMAYIPFERLEDGTALSSSSQILIALVEPAPQFKEQLSFFGKVVDGLELLSQVEMDDTIETVRISEGVSGEGASGVNHDAGPDEGE